MLFYILFGLMVVILIVIITAIAQPPTRWVEHYVQRQQKSSKFPAKKLPASIEATHTPDMPSASQSGDTDSQKSGSHPA